MSRLQKAIDLVKAKYDKLFPASERGALRAKRHKRQARAMRTPTGRKIRSPKKHSERFHAIAAGASGRRGEKIVGGRPEEEGVHLHSGKYATKPVSHGGKSPRAAARTSIRGKRGSHVWRTGGVTYKPHVHSEIMRQQKKIKPRLTKAIETAIEILKSKPGGGNEEAK